MCIDATFGGPLHAAVNLPAPPGAPPSLLVGDAAIVIRQARWKAALLTAAGAGFAVLGLLMRREPGFTGVVGWFCAAFFGLGAAVGAAQLAWPGRLVVSPEGLTLQMLWRKRVWPWSAVDAFGVWRAKSTTLVVFEDASARTGALTRMNRALGASSGSLPPGWRVKPEALALLLAQAKARWG